VAAAVVFAVVAGYEGLLIAGTVLAGLALLLNVAQQMYMIPLGTALKIAWVSALDLARQLASVLAVILLVVAGAGLLPFLAVPLPVGLLVLVMTIVLVRGAIPFRPAFERTQWKHVLQLTLVYSAAAAVASIYASLTVVIGSLLTSDKEIGYYGASFRVFSVLSAMPLLAVNLAFPILARAAENDESRFRYVIQRLFETSLIFGAWLSLATILGASFAIHIVAGPDFAPSVPVLQIQGAALVATFLTVTWGTGLLALHRHRALLLANLVGLATSGLTTILLVPDHGAKGAAIATLAGESALALSYTVALLGRDRRLRFEIAVIPKVMVAVAAALLIALIPGLERLPLVVAASAAYFAVLWALRAIQKELPASFMGR
jgi:O-antigen/teichoic acid export membrane protein